ncbi:MAG: DNA-binding domain-containing protein [Gammaproteobacteria bacterium]|nr:DNA-binding domain-containing protein [Gammaproteobacteria bacterium]
MNTLRKLQYEFLDYLLDDSIAGIVERIESNQQCSAEERMTFYGNAYTLRLKEALSTDYERLHSYLGDELFDSLMQHYIDSYPSQHPSLRYFGRHMVELVEQLEPFKTLTEVAEITRIEQAFANSFDAADCPSVSLDQLAQLNLEAWASLTLQFQGAIQLLPQQHNSFQIWQALANEETPPQKTSCDTTWLIWRQDLVSHYRALENGELTALTTAMSTGSFAGMCEAMLEQFSEQETPLKTVEYLQQWINDQMVTALN